MQKIKYLIIGGGLAGATLGYKLLSNNIKDVIIIEKNELPKDKLCGGIISSKSQNELKNILQETELENIYQKKYKTVLLEAKKNIEFKNLDIKIAKRINLDNCIIKKYIDLNGKYFKDELLNIDIRNNIAILKSGEKIEYEYLISSDGANSKVRRLIDKKYNTNSMLFSYEAVTDVENLKEEYKNKLIINFIDFKKGYGWIINRNNDVVVGMGNISGNKEIKREYEIFLEKILIDPKIKYKGAFLPNGKNIKLKKNNIIFLGDAAGIISPISGEGIYYALKTADILKECILEEDIEKYEIKCGFIKKRIKKELFLSKFIYNKIIQNIVFGFSDNKLIKKGIDKIMIKYILE